jgi:RHS repeat-associated protein
VPVYTDRLGSVVRRGTQVYRYYPHGEPFGTNPVTAGPHFATYERDQVAGLDQAWNRGYLPTYGRFAQADPYQASGGPKDPGSWNRYGYTRGDPVNRYDPPGLADFSTTGYCYGCLATPFSFELSWAIGFYLGGGRVWLDSDMEWGGGGSPVPQPLITITNLSKTGSSYNTVNNRLTDIENEIDEDCLRFLQSGGHELGRHIRDLRDSNLLAVGRFNRNDIAAITGTYGSNLPEGEAAIVVNANGAFFRSAYTVNQGKLTGGTAKAQVFILLHELAHSLEAKGFLADLNNASHGEANDRKIEANCAKTLARFQ